MGLYFTENNDVVSDRKLYLHLSEQCWNVIDSDISVFENTSEITIRIYGHFLSRVFCSMFEDGLYPANLSGKLAGKKEQLEKVLGTFKLSASERVSLVNKLLEVSALEFLPEDKVSSGKAIRIRVNKEVNAHLHSLGDNSLEEKAFQKNGAYFHSVFEQYACFSPAERERIFFYRIYKQIQAAIASGSVLSVSLQQSKKPELLVPVFLEADQYQMHYYVIFIHVHEKKQQLLTQISNIRLTKIEKLLTMQQTFFVLKEQKELIRQQIAKNGGVQHFYDAPQEVQILLTQKGIANLNNWGFQRPPYKLLEKKSDGSCVISVNVTLYQVIIYFWKFGKEAIILSPDSLRLKFQKMYQEAVEKYKEHEKILDA